MKKYFGWLSFLLLALVWIPGQEVFAQTVMDTLSQDEDGRIEFQFLGEEESETSLPNFPIRIRLEGLDTNQAQIRMIWDLEDESLDEIFPVSITPTMNEEIRVLPDGAPYLAGARIEFINKDLEYYGGDLYLTDLPSHSGLQIMVPNYAGNVETYQEDFYQMLTQINDTPVITEDGLAFNIQDLDQAMLDWQNQVGGNFYRIYPPNKAELDHGGLTFNDLMENMVLDALGGGPVNPLETPGYTLHAVYSPSIVGRSSEEVITYVMLDYEGHPQVWVTEQTDTSQPIKFHLSENAEIVDLFEQWYYYSESLIGQPQPEESLSIAQMLANRDMTFDADQALSFAGETGGPIEGNIQLKLGENIIEDDPEKDYQVILTVTEKIPGYYYMHVSAGGIGTSLDFFAYGGQIFTVRRAFDPFTYSVVDPTTYEMVENGELSEDEKNELLNIESELGVGQ